jgi:hypothetical protein
MPGNPLVRLCVQQRLACSVGDKPTGAKVRSPVAWIARRKETESLKPIDLIILGMTASHWAVTKVNADVASKVSGPRGRACNCKAKAAWVVAPD